jgi:hypothetical protein
VVLGGSQLAGPLFERGKRLSAIKKIAVSNHKNYYSQT